MKRTGVWLAMRMAVLVLPAWLIVLYAGFLIRKRVNARAIAAE